MKMKKLLEKRIILLTGLKEEYSSSREEYSPSHEEYSPSHEEYSLSDEEYSSYFVA